MKLKIGVSKAREIFNENLDRLLLRFNSNRKFGKFNIRKDVVFRYFKREIFFSNKKDET